MSRAEQEPPVRVLLVEDSDAAAEVVRRRLAEASWPRFVIERAGGLEQAEAHLGETWDVILLDLGLPGCEGLQALSWMRARCPELPIVVLTGQEDLDLALRALEAEAQDYVIKRQIDTDTLVRTIRYAIGRQSILARLARAVGDARALMERSSDGIVVFGPDERVVLANPAAQELLRGEAELVGRAIRGLDLTREQAEIALEGPDARVIDVRIVDVEWEGRPARMALLRDVTGRRRAEELRVQLERAERLAAVGQLAAGVAHEINNPLTYVRINLDVVLRRLPAGGQGDFLRERLLDAQEGLERVVRIVRDLRVFARVEPDPHPHPIDVRDAIESALKMAEPHLKHRARVHRALEEVPLVLAAEGRLSQVFLNLLINAAQAIDEGHVSANRIDVRTALDGERVSIEVRDTGRGIPREHLRLLFEPFFSTKHDGESSGLGLSICRSIVQAFGGSIEAQSEEGVGTCVRVHLPVWRGHHAPLARESAAPHPAREARSRVLIVDDEPAILRALTEVLCEHHAIATAGSGEEARALLERDSAFDVVLCDLVMDSGTGMELFRWLEQRQPALAPRVVFMSGGGTTPEAERFVAAHSERTLTKPLAVDRVLLKIRELARAPG